jgi:imidazolonepropionase
VTLNAAASLALGEELGSLEPGKRADLVILDEPNLFHLAYHFGVNPVRSVIKGGHEVYRAGNLLLSH